MPDIDIAQLATWLVEDESLKLLVYDDATEKPIKPGTVVIGHPTIGIGRALDVHGISKAEAAYLLTNDMASVIEQLGRALPWFGSLDPVRAGVLADMAFNLGLTGLLCFHVTLGLIESRQYSEAADSMLKSKWAAQVGGRAKRLAERMRTGLAAAVLFCCIATAGWSQLPVQTGASDPSCVERLDEVQRELVGLRADIRRISQTINSTNEGLELNAADALEAQRLNARLAQAAASTATTALDAQNLSAHLAQAAASTAAAQSHEQIVAMLCGFGTVLFGLAVTYVKGRLTDKKIETVFARSAEQ
ncbi:glycoside hydrolase family protein [Nevskia soli]|uniref:glycoside hydrolase family protein n=1 Tax=Nevskia soli TaxID=418856 RepID=UPI0015D68114|nr:hypothetical protein [Nevskia soli]